MINETLKDQIQWVDIDRTTAKDIIANYESYISFFYDNRISQIDKCICFDNQPIDMGMVVTQIAEALYNDLKIKNKTNIKIVIKSIANKHQTITSNNEDGSPIAQKYLEEFNDIQENIENDISSLKDILGVIDDIPDSDWDLYKKWKKNDCLYTYDKDGNITGVDTCYMNIINWLENYPLTKNQIKWNNVRNIATWKGIPLTDKMMHQIMQMINKHLSKEYGNLKALRDAIIGCAVKNRYNPWVDYFNQLSYNNDDIDWIEYTIKNVLCCEEQDKYYDLYYETLKIMLLGCMKRIYYKELYNQPVKYDMVVYFCGENGGSGKTTFFERLFDLDCDGNTYCYVVPGDSFNPKDKDFLERTHQSTCVLIDEITMKRSMVTSIKGYITARSDKFRVSYGYNSEDNIRGFIITATSNNTDFLKDFTTDNERRCGIIKTSEDKNNYIKVNKAFDEGLMNKLWAQIKEIYDSNNYILFIKPDTELYNLETEIQRGYKASNNADYNTIVNDLLEREYGFYDSEIIDVEAIVAQYKFGNSLEWCKEHNFEYREKIRKSAEDKYIIRPEDRPIKYFGKINRIPKKTLYDILDKLSFEYTKVSFNAEIRYSGKWNGWQRGNNICRINGTLVNAYWRIDKSDLNEYTDNELNEKQKDDTEKLNQIQDGLPF